ncbi:MAG: hypothetical protein BA862_05785 [Desulfobulbaceae bacterium S3730MH12]|nr:MAG: hypothetical protein BA862_05785 [Desulfobulbaceae bacterium S3730MH12]OEU83826.1 MAG: hypothetical protein BA873_12160 [Desulfobulbaceae bacterium C00003063]
MANSEVHTFEDEWYIVRYSGEIPEIAFNSAIHYLSRAQDGPHLTLSEEQNHLLKKAALDRYHEIVIRDLLHENHQKPIYRGIKRSIDNYHRLRKFCFRQQLDPGETREEAARLLPLFLKTEVDEVKKYHRPSIINCTYSELQQFAEDLQVPLSIELKRLSIFAGTDH